ncbi:MAG TPA: hypothetical protein VJ623_13165 [Holophagaceae bacterium]|nr:hypothetical protein [Holophagaceae bacterium]
MTPAGWILGALLALGGGSAPGSPRVSRTGQEPQGHRWGLEVPPMEAPTELARPAEKIWLTLKADLQAMGPFTLAKGPEAPPTFRASTRMARGPEGRLTIHLHLVDLRTKATLLKRAYPHAAPASLAVAHRMADDLTERATGLRGAAESRITFALERGPGVKEIFDLDRSGEHLRQRTFFGSLTTSPTVARDGRLAFITYKGGPPELWGQKAPGAPPVRLYPVGRAAPHETLAAPAWSPSGTSIAFVKEDRHGHSDLYLLDLVKEHVRPLTAEREINTEPAWNPTGTALAFTSTREGQPHIYRLNLADGQVQRVSPADQASTSPAWSPDGTSLAYSTRYLGHVEIAIQPLAGGAPHAIPAPGGSIETPVWSPDGRWVLFIQGQGEGARLRLADPLTGLSHPLGTVSGVSAPDWSRIPETNHPTPEVP